MNSSTATKDLFTVSHRAENPKAVVLMTHGLGEHSGRYQELVDRMLAKNYTIFQYDLPGHGKSAGQSSSSVTDFKLLTSAIHSQYEAAFTYATAEGLPLFIFGHSLGGLITAHYMSHYQPECRGVILSAPSLNAGDLASGWLVKAAKILSKILPNFPYLKLKSTDLTRDAVEIEKFESDPLVRRDPITFRLGYVFLMAMNATVEKVSEFNKPVLVIQGEEDQIVKMETTRNYFNRLAVTDKTYISYPGMRHETLNELDNEQVYEDIIQWIDNRLA